MQLRMGGKMDATGYIGWSFVVDNKHELCGIFFHKFEVGDLILKAIADS